MKFVYFGSSQFSRIVLDILLEKGKCPSLVVTVPDKPSGRGLKLKATPVKNIAKQAGIEVLSPSSLKNDSFIERLTRISAEIFVVVSYGKIIPKNVLDAARLIPVAVHPSLLPLYRGAAPINWAIINGDRKTGVSIIKVSEKVDAGEIIAQESLRIDDRDDALTLSEKLAKLSARVLLDTLSSIEKGKYTLIAQDDSKVTFAPKIRKEDGRISWENDAFSIRNLVRGLLPWPEAFTFYKGKIIKILEADAYYQKTSQEPVNPKSSTRRVEQKVTAQEEGIIYGGLIKRRPSTILKIDKRGIYVAAGRGMVVIKRVKPEGKKGMDAYAFSRGHDITPGETFGR